MNKYKKIKILGKGTFGTASLFRRKKWHEQVVIKEIFIDLENDTHLKDALNEVLVLAMLNHPNIIQYYDSFVDNNKLNIVMEYGSKGTLYNYLIKQKSFLPINVRVTVHNIFCQILLAVDHMHNNNILHRDIKTENVMLTGTDGNVIKVGDFGISKILSDHTRNTSTIIGTPNYLAPEICRGEPYGIKSDIWSLGCILYEICALKRMFEGELVAVALKIATGEIKTIDTKIYPEELQELISWMCNMIPQHRPNVENIMAKKYIVPHLYKLQVNLGKIESSKCLMKSS